MGLRARNRNPLRDISATHAAYGKPKSGAVAGFADKETLYAGGYHEIGFVTLDPGGTSIPVACSKDWFRVAALYKL